MSQLGCESYVKTYPALILIHFGVAAAHLGSIIAIMILSGDACTANTTEMLNLYTPVREWNTITMSIVPRYSLLPTNSTIPHTLYPVPSEYCSFSPLVVILYILCVSFFGSLGAGLALCTGYKTSRPLHELLLQSKNWVTIIRWAEYTVTDPAMIWMIAYYSGIVDPLMLITLAVVTGVASASGYALVYVHDLLENGPLSQDNDELWYLHAVMTIGLTLFALALQCIVWVMLIWNFVDTSTQMPGFGYTLFISEAVMFIALSVIQVVWSTYNLSKKSRETQMFTHTPVIEYMYPLITAISRTLLVWILFQHVVREGC
jgi:hypothetical protein